MKPLPALLAAGAVAVAAVALENPLWPAAAAVAAAMLLAVAGPPRRMYVTFALTSGLTVLALEPFVAVQGLTVLWQGPEIPVLDTQVTLEEVVFGAAAALRIAATALAAAAFVRLADSDLLLRAVARVAPRSAMIAALSTQMLPALERDAAGIVLAARTRAARISRPQTAARLMGPLVGMSLERALAIAEAMEARGYGGPARAAAPVRPATGRERGLTALGAAAVAVVATAIATGAGGYRYFDTLGDPFRPAAVAGSAALLLALTAFAAVVPWRR
ncbi:MAG TPA: energy-coupling factor transporter transmembrane component T [Gaiellales bacterium]|nr:energy-coupling factor transporter transmembrane component T [Gaiellales bacterium]